jgi:hypothetical protein
VFRGVWSTLCLTLVLQLRTSTHLAYNYHMSCPTQQTHATGISVTEVLHRSTPSAAQRTTQ